MPADKSTITLGTERRELILPVGEDDFARFIADLLGKPQSIENRYYGPFDLELQDIETCFHLVDQRIKQQNQATLVQFSVRITYDDNSSVLLNTLDEFLAYREVRPVTSVAAHMSWTYLIKFQDRLTPEKQVIELSISASQRRRTAVFGESDIVRFDDQRGRFFLRIAHTARSWGTDIENLLTGQIKQWIREEHGIKRFINHHAGWIGFASGFSFFTLIIWGLHKATLPAVESFRAAAERVSGGSLDERIAFLIQAQVNNPLYSVNLLSWPTVIGIAVISIGVGVLVGTLADNPPKSYLVLSDKARKAREERLRERVWTWRYFIGSAIASTIAGVSSRYLFAVFFSNTWP